MNLEISILACQRPHCLLNLLMSLDRQILKGYGPYGAKEIVNIWMDKPKKEKNLDLWKSCSKVIDQHPFISSINFVRQHRGVSDMMITRVIPHMLDSSNCHFLFLEDDVFLTERAINNFQNALEVLEDPKIFSIYGDTPQKSAVNFRSVGWMTTKEKLQPIYEILKELYESKQKWQKYLDKNNEKFFATHPRPSGYYKGSVIGKNFMWGMMMCYICIVEELIHKRTKEIVAYHTGIEDEFSVNARGIKHGDSGGRHVDPKLAWLYY